MSNLELYTYPNNPRALKVLIAAEYGSSALSHPPFSFGETDARPEFLATFPTGRVPALKLAGSGGGIEGASAISAFLADEKLFNGRDEVERARVLQWMFYAESELWPLVCHLVYPALGIELPSSKEQSEKYAAAVEKELRSLDGWLTLRTYLAAERVTLADVSVFSTLYLLFALEGLRGAVQAPVRFLRWFRTIENQREVQSALKKFDFSVKPAPRPSANGKGKIACCVSTSILLFDVAYLLVFAIFSPFSIASSIPTQNWTDVHCN